MEELYFGLWTGSVFFCGGLFGLWLRMRQEKAALAKAWFQGLKDRPLVDRALAEYHSRKDNSEGITNAHQRV
jgi:hypothetical protein